MKTQETFKEANEPDGYTLLGTVDFDNRIEEKPYYTVKCLCSWGLEPTALSK